VRPTPIRIARAAARLLAALLLLGALVLGTPAPAGAAAGAGGGAGGAWLPRKVVALYNGVEEPRLRSSAVHQFVAMPLNWLGLVVEFRDASRPLPPVWDDPDVLGVVSWFPSPALPRPAEYLDWAERVLASGRRFVLLGDLGVAGDKVPPGRVERFYASLGLRYGGGWSPVTYDTELVLADPALTGFERALDGPLPPFELFAPADPSARTYLKARRPAAGGAEESHLVVVTRAGGFVAPGYAHFRDPATLVSQWYVDPFAFFERALGLAGRPVPDVTTLSGRRMYYSHVDGDGWLNRSQAVPVPKGEEAPYASEVILDRAVAPYPDLPVTVAPIAAELDPAWGGSEEARRIARALFALPQVEPASHTYTHPFQWDFFEDYAPGKEAPFAGLYGDGALHGDHDAAADDAPPPAGGLRPGYRLPRAYGGRPFDLDQEMRGAADHIALYAPPGKRVGLVQWSGDTSPFEGAVAAARRAGLANINGGDSRLDSEYPSVSYLAPVGRPVGAEVQVYASASNENTYTGLWTGRYFGFRDLRESMDNTERPRRLKPINLYYHMYSGERAASLKALLANLAHVRAQEICPVPTGRYVSAARGFFTLRLAGVGERSWRVSDRGGLHTLRFPATDGAEGAEVEVDLDRSPGVIGQRVHQGQLYVALDPAAAEPVVTLRARVPGPPARPELVQSRWEVSALETTPDGFAFTAQGFGPGETEWRVPAPGRYAVAVGPARIEAVAGPDGRLAAVLGDGTGEPVRVGVRRIAGTP
jgi:hypothetical protein